MQLPGNSPLTQGQSQSVQPAAGHGRQAVGQRQGSPAAPQAAAPGAVQNGRDAPRQILNAGEFDRNAPRGTYLNIII